MKQLIRNNRSGKLSIEEVPMPSLVSGSVIVQNLYSAVSLGTEMSQVSMAKKSLIDKARSRPSDLKKVLKLIEKEGVLTAYRKSMNKLELPATLGYSSVGIIIEVSSEVKSLAIGDIVSCGGSGHAEVVLVPENLCAKVSEGVNVEDAAYATIASIALQGVRQSGAKLGESIGVIGLGLVGLITLKLLKANGCNAYGIDINDSAVKRALNLGFNCYNTTDSNVHSKINNVTNGYGLDSVIITASTTDNNPIELGSDLSRDRGSIIIVGNVKTDLPRKNFYNKELQLKFSRSYGPGRYDLNYENKGHDYPIGFVRWTERRNIEAILSLLKKESISFQDFNSEIFDFKHSPEAYDKLSKKEIDNPVLLKYSSDIKLNKSLIVNKSVPSLDGLNVGIIGTGNYAQNILIPLISKIEGINFVGVASTKGMNSKHVADKYKFDFCTTNPADITSNKDIDIVFILTRHDSHSGLVVEALKNDKHVYVEKPLSIDYKGLEKIKSALSDSKGTITVGYNRRYSPAVSYVMDEKNNNPSPVSINCIINPGEARVSHWTNDLDIGGGRIIGEFCHFIDLCTFIANSEIDTFTYASLEENNSRLGHNETVSVLLKHRNGSVSNICYFCNGNSNYPKEKMEIFSDGQVFLINDFKEVSKYTSKRITKKNFGKQDKGHENTLKMFFKSVGKGETLMDFETLFDISKKIFEIR